MTRPIGGFLELELGAGLGEYHPGAATLSTGRGCLNLLIQQLRPAKLLLPYYACDALLEPILLSGVPYEFYELDTRLEPRRPLEPGPNQYVIYINYFGIKTAATRRLADRYPGKLIVDNAQAFFVRGSVGRCSFNSARKFFGVADGAYLYFPETSLPALERNTLTRWDHLIERLEGRTESAYRLFREYERGLSCDMRRVSAFSEALLARVDYAQAEAARLANYDVYQRAFGDINRLDARGPEDVPLCYPLLLERDYPRAALHERGIFVPSFWSEVATRLDAGFAFEKEVARNLLPLPLDHRYSTADCGHVVDEVRRLIGKRP